MCPIAKIAQVLTHFLITCQCHHSFFGPPSTPYEVVFFKHTLIRLTHFLIPVSRAKLANGPSVTTHFSDHQAHLMRLYFKHTLIGLTHLKYLSLEKSLPMVPVSPPIFRTTKHIL